MKFLKAFEQFLSPQNHFSITTSGSALLLCSMIQQGQTKDDFVVEGSKGSRAS